MNNEIITFTAEPALTRLVYLKTVLIIFGTISIIHFAGQWRTQPLIDYKISLVICLSLGLLTLYGLTRTPLTQKFQIFNDKQKIVVEYLTLTKTENLLEIPFERLNVKIDTSFGTTSYGSKWKAILLLDGKEKYSLFNDEQGFSEAQMNEFIEKAKSCAAK